MNELKFLEEFGKIDDDLVKEADVRENIKPPALKRNICTIVSVAAAAVLITAGAATFYNTRNTPESFDNTSIIMPDDAGSSEHNDSNEQNTSPELAMTTREAIKTTPFNEEAETLNTTEAVDENDMDNDEIVEISTDSGYHEAEPNTDETAKETSKATGTDSDFPSDDFCRWLGEIVINGKNYIQTDSDPYAYTASQYLGTASDFEGQYDSPYEHKWCDLSDTDEIYTVSESEDILLVKHQDGSIMLLQYSPER